MTKIDIQAEIEKIQNQQRMLVFSRFANDTAWDLGNLMVDAARRQNLPVSLCITVNKQRLFCFACPGTSPNNDRFIARKENMVYECLKSSYEMVLQAQLDPEHDFMKFWGLDSQDFVLAGGSFPITVENIGVIGAVTCSGLAEKDDHAFVVSCLQKYLAEH